MAGLFYAPDAQLFLNLGATGVATGNIDVAGLNIYYAGNMPAGGSTLTGKVAGRTGSAAAATGFIHANAAVNYQVNGCPIQSINCILLSPVVVPLGSPIHDIDVRPARRREDDDDLILPNVAEQDY